MKEVEVLGKSYQVGKMSAMRQMLILKRIAPVAGPMQAIAAGFDDKAPEGALRAVGDAVAALPDEALEFITNSCLDVCRMKQTGGGWAPVRKDGTLMFPDLDLLTVLSLAAHALIYNFRDFFCALPSIARAGGKAPKI